MRIGISHVVCAVLAAILAVTLFSYFVKPAADGVTQPASVASVYDRVMQAGVIRCGYTPYSVGLMKDPNTGAISGIYHDVVEQLAANLSLKVEWVEEVGWSTQIEGLNTDRFDMICSPVSLNSGRARQADFSIPLFYSPVQVWARSDDARFDGNRAAINDPAIRISTLDGEQTSVFAKNFFPKAQQISLPQTAPFSDLLLQVTTGKADVVFAEPLSVYEFMENNKNSLKLVTAEKPLVLVPNIILLKRDQFAFKQMIDNTLREMFNTGAIDMIIDRYEKYPKSYVRETALR